MWHAVLVCGSLLGQTPTFDVDPKAVQLDGRDARFTLLVRGADGVDLTRDVAYRVLDPKIASVDSAGRLRAHATGKTAVEVTGPGGVRSATIEVVGANAPRELHFENDIVPLLSRFGCNAAGCHGSADGQNGFKLSVFGFDPPADHAAIVREARGRRLLTSAPDASLFLQKAAGTMAHGGGVRIRPGTLEYGTLRDWIAAGAPMGDPQAPRVVSLRVAPKERVLPMKATQALRAVATYSDGKQVDVTALAKFQSNNDGVVAVSEDGVTSAGVVAGEGAVMASYLGAVDVFRVLVPRAEPVKDYPKLAEANFIDPLVHAQLRKLHIVPSDRCTDAEFLRRVSLDLIGLAPTAAEARAFLADSAPDKRARLVDALLARPEYAELSALVWADVLRVDRQALGPKRAYAYYRWIRDSFAENKPFDQFARELIQAEGPLDEVGPANFFKVAPKAGEAASSLSQILLGVRIACAECHHHPFDRWSQSDYVGMQGFFSQVSLRKNPAGEAVEAIGDPVGKHPRTGVAIHAHALGQPAPDASPAGDRREALAVWMTSPKNPWFAKNLANRLWARFLGRGLVEPVDDVRDTNPPSNPALLDSLAKQVVDAKFDVKAVVRTIVLSETYQRSSRPNASNAQDEINASRALFRRIPAEVLLDVVSQATGVPEKFKGMPTGTRAVQLWDSKTPHYFLKLYGRPQRISACECERNHEPGVSQVLHLLNAPTIHEKLGHDRGAVARLVRSHSSNEALADELYLTYFARFPTAEERAIAVRALATGDRRAAAEDLAWSLMNSLEFVFNR